MIWGQTSSLIKICGLVSNEYEFLISFPTDYGTVLGVEEPAERETQIFDGIHSCWATIDAPNVDENEVSSSMMILMPKRGIAPAGTEWVQFTEQAFFSQGWGLVSMVWIEKK